MSAPIRTSYSCTRHRGGFSLMEVLVVLAIFALSTAIIMPSTSKMLDQTMSHAVYFEFQRQISDLRREASRTGQYLTLVAPTSEDVGIALPTTRGEADFVRMLNLRDGWTYTLSTTLEIEAGGRCSSVTANLIHQGRVVMTLVTEDGTCRFVRYLEDQLGQHRH